MEKTVCAVAGSTLGQGQDRPTQLQHNACTVLLLEHEHDGASAVPTCRQCGRLPSVPAQIRFEMAKPGIMQKVMPLCSDLMMFRNGFRWGMAWRCMYCGTKAWHAHAAL